VKEQTAERRKALIFKFLKRRNNPKDEDRLVKDRVWAKPVLCQGTILRPGHDKRQVWLWMRYERNKGNAGEDDFNYGRKCVESAGLTGATWESDFEDVYKPKDVVTFTAKELLAKIQQTGTFGPWI
jgi:hypothetical protein